MEIKYLVIDVDGTMTDAGIYYDEYGNEMKKFCTKDAAGFFAAKELGIKIMVLTGRECKATERRMKEMKVEYLYQNVHDKVTFLRDFMVKNQISEEQIAYIGDDINDLAAMKLCGYVGCPEDSCKEVKKIADYISCEKGGNGAVRDIIEHLLKTENLWEKALSSVYGIGI